MKSNRKIQIPDDKELYLTRHKIEIFLGKLKDWRRIHTRDTTAASPPSCPQSPTPQSSSSGYDQSVLSLGDSQSTHFTAIKNMIYVENTMIKTVKSVIYLGNASG